MRNATSASKKSRALRGWRPSRCANALSSSGALESSVETPSSIALRRVLEPQNPKPSWRIESGEGTSFMGVLRYGKGVTLLRNRRWPRGNAVLLLRTIARPGGRAAGIDASFVGHLCPVTRTGEAALSVLPDRGR